MPIQTYINEDNETIEVIRRVSEWDKPPTEDETDGKKGPWTRQISSGIGKRLSNAFGFGKGYHNNQTPNKRIP